MYSDIVCFPPECAVRVILVTYAPVLLVTLIIQGHRNGGGGGGGGGAGDIPHVYSDIVCFPPELAR